MKSRVKGTGRGRPPSIDSERLLAAAREVFLERGIRATTLEVASRAGVSEGVLFHRFKSKEGLFRAAMEVQEEDVPRLFLEAVDAVKDLEIDAALQQLAATLLQVGLVAMPLMMMSWSNPDRCQVPHFDKKKAFYNEFVKNLAAFFEKQMRLGRIRQMDSELLARSFLGGIHHYCMTRILTSEDETTFPESMFVRGYVDLLLHGAVASPEQVASVGPRRVSRV